MVVKVLHPLVLWIIMKLGGLGAVAGDVPRSARCLMHYGYSRIVV